MKVLFFLLIFCTLSSVSFSQKKNRNKPVSYTEIDNIALQIPESLSYSIDDISNYINSMFTSESDKVRAAYIWVCSNIKYDYENMFALNFYEKKEDKIIKALMTRKGICENYAIIFSEICKSCHLKSYVIEGYTKQNGFTDYIPHAWAAANVDSVWYLFDPTWGSGYIQNGKFINKIDNTFFKASPDKLIKSHMPFDYLWQFLSEPITNKEFKSGKIDENKPKVNFNFNDSIKAYDSLSYNQQIIDAA